MPSIKFPSDADRYVLTYDGKPARRAAITLYSDTALTVPAEIYEDSAGVKGALIASSIVETDNRGFLSTYWGPDSGQDTLYYRVTPGGDVWPVHADTDYRLDVLEVVSGALTVITGTATLTSAHGTVLASAAAPYTITLPTAVGITGRRYTIVKTDNNANVVTVGTTSAQTINGVTTYVGLNAQYRRVTVVSDGSNWIIVQANDQPQPSAFMLASGYYFAPDGVRTAAAMVANQEWAVPIRIGRAGTVDRIGIDVTVAGTAGTVIRLGIRASLADGQPGTLMLDAGTVSGAAVAMPEITISQYFPREGLYWLTATPQSTGGTLPTVRGISSASAPIGHSSIAGALGATPTAGYATTGVTGALPTNYPTPSRIGLGPLIALRAV